MIIFELENFILPSNNTYYRKFRNIMTLSEKGKAFKKQYVEFIKALKYEQIKGKVGIELEIYFKDKRKRDLDNYFKALFDNLKNTVIEDDENIYEIKAKKIIGYGKNLIKIKIYSLEEKWKYHNKELT